MLSDLRLPIQLPELNRNKNNLKCSFFCTYTLVPAPGYVLLLYTLVTVKVEMYYIELSV